MNPVLILTHNCLELTKKCVRSVEGQSIQATPFVWDNGSTDGTREYLAARGSTHHVNEGNRGVSAGWNWMLDYLFKIRGANHVLVLNNDTIIPPLFYSKLLSYDVPFITGVSVDSMGAIEQPSQWSQPAESPDFSAFLIRRDCWEKVGTFDEAMVHYASDLDYHVRAHQIGIPLLNSGVPFYHERSSTLRLASPEDRVAIEARAEADRETFRLKYGTKPGQPGYEELFK